MSMPPLTLRLGSLSIDAPKRKAAFDPKRSGHYGLPNDSATPLALVALSRIAQARDDAILNAAATAPVGALLVNALRAAVHRLARDGGATSAFTDATANAFLQTAASTIAMQRRYAQAGLTLPSALPWASAKKLAQALLDSVTAVRHSASGMRLHTLLLTLPPPPMNDEARAAVAAFVAAVEAETATRIADGGAPPSSAASTSSATTDPLPLPLPLPVPVDAAPFALDGAAGVSDNVARLVQSALRRQIDASERATLDAALEQGLGLLQEGGGAEARRQLLASSSLAALTSTGVAFVWAAALERAENGIPNVDAYARDVVDGCSELAAALFSASLGL
jgi:hypothetical protein